MCSGLICTVLNCFVPLQRSFLLCDYQCAVLKYLQQCWQYVTQTLVTSVPLSAKSVQCPAYRVQKKESSHCDWTQILSLKIVRNQLPSFMGHILWLSQMCNDFISVRTWSKQITNECAICLSQIWTSPKKTIFSDWTRFLCLFWLWLPANCLQGAFSAHRLCHSGSVLHKSALRP